MLSRRFPPLPFSRVSRAALEGRRRCDAARLCAPTFSYAVGVHRRSSASYKIRYRICGIVYLGLAPGCEVILARTLSDPGGLRGFRFCCGASEERLPVSQSLPCSGRASQQALAPSRFCDNKGAAKPDACAKGKAYDRYLCLHQGSGSR
jgi:hypothetical protein